MSIPLLENNHSTIPDASTGLELLSSTDTVLTDNVKPIRNRETLMSQFEVSTSLHAKRDDNSPDRPTKVGSVTQE